MKPNSQEPKPSTRRILYTGLVVLSVISFPINIPNCKNLNFPPFNTVKATGSHQVATQTPVTSTQQGL